MADDNEVLRRFLSQPAEHGFNDDDPAAEAPAPMAKVRWRVRLRHFLFEKEPSQYSSISPRLPDGTRTKPFFFNGNGRGR